MIFVIVVGDIIEGFCFLHRLSIKLLFKHAQESRHSPELLHTGCM